MMHLNDEGEMCQLGGKRKLLVSQYNWQILSHPQDENVNLYGITYGQSKEAFNPDHCGLLTIGVECKCNL